MSLAVGYPTMNNNRVTVWGIIQKSPKEAVMLVSLAMLVAAVSFQFLKMIAEVAR
jgi:hypothetical protein